MNKVRADALNQKGFAPILIVLLITVVIGGYLLYSGKINLPQKQITTQTTSADETANPDLIGANWKTYKAFSNFYSISYPSKWYQYGNIEALKDGSFSEFFSSKPDSVNRWADLAKNDYAFSIDVAPANATTYESGKTYLEMFPFDKQAIGTKKDGAKDLVELVGFREIDGIKGIEIERTLQPGMITDYF